MSNFRVKTGAGLAGVLIFVVLMVILGPLLAIWSLNTLFAMNIEYSLVNWLAAVILTNVIRPSFNSGK